ncbi:MAG TPA: GNAT family N-acetyltransferase [Acidimicrobiia bacterium]|jgi:GNAT superfamily N-acetyltransferase|nr:GNAT family N-acetyltransferase [Acidimicrobiia bacterium]
MPDIDIDHMRGDERDAAVLALARAFHDDPLFNFLVPNLRSQSRALVTFMGSLLADARPFGEVWVARADRAIAGVAVWLPPGAFPRGTRREVAAYAREMPSVHRLGRRLPAALRLQALLDRKHHEVAEPHWYLSLLGTDPSFQRRGVGSALLAPVLARAHEQGIPAYLETQKEMNVPYYRRHGFELVEQIQARGCPPMWTMSRAEP